MDVIKGQNKKAMILFIKGDIVIQDEGFSLYSLNSYLPPIDGSLHDPKRESLEPLSLDLKTPYFGKFERKTKKIRLWMMISYQTLSLALLTLSLFPCSFLRMSSNISSASSSFPRP